LKLHYSVNGGKEQAVTLLATKGAQTAEGRTLITLEEHKMAPGDIVAFYASARDAQSTARTDMFFVEAQPFERNFTQAQAAGGEAGGGNDEPNKISQRQKEIIAATWNEINDRKSDRATSAENARFLADVQSKLRDQARSLANRMKSRELAGANQEFKSFVADMEKAVEAMGPASDKLKGMQWQEALGPEQKALQHLLRAEATFRDIQVAFGNRGGGGGGGGMGRELESLFDLELDTEKNQYETGQRAGSAEQRQKEIDEALQKLEQLARRQQELAEQQRRNQQSTQQRWQQEMLRREAEQLQRQVEQLSRNQQGQQLSRTSTQGGQQSSQSQQSGERGQPGQPSQQQQQLERALEKMRQATQDMQNAAAAQNNGSPRGEAEARRAAERLQEARDLLRGMRKEQTGEQMAGMVKESERLADRQRDFEQRLRKEVMGQAQGPNGQPAGLTREKAEQLAGEKEAMQRDLKSLEKTMQDSARDLATTDRASSEKIRRALGQVQQEETARNMGLHADGIRKGWASYIAPREALATQSLNNLRDRLRDTQAGMGKDGKSGEKGLEQALNQAEAVRRQMDQLARSLGRQQGQQPGQRGQQGQQGQNGQQGQQPGQQG
ncbi:MAG: hypothetical protein ACREU7_09770, partial [Burkholderiales bacterium]